MGRCSKCGRECIPPSDCVLCEIIKARNSTLEEAAEAARYVIEFGTGHDLASEVPAAIRALKRRIDKSKPALACKYCGEPPEAYHDTCGPKPKPCAEEEDCDHEPCCFDNTPKPQALKELASPEYNLFDPATMPESVRCPGCLKRRKIRWACGTCWATATDEQRTHWKSE